MRYCDALWNDPVNPFFKQVVNEHDINTVLLGALCHDIGHYPSAHDFEEADNDLFSHTRIFELLLTKDISPDTHPLDQSMRDDWGVSAQEVVDLLMTKPSDFNKPLKLRFLHSLIEGPIDADKLDYLMRDSNNLNLPYGQCIDFERLLRCLTIVFEQMHPETFIALGVHEKGKIPAEAIAFARYAMFGSVYWHHTSRSLKSMLHRALWEALPGVDKRRKEYVDFHNEFLSVILDKHAYHNGQNSQQFLFPRVAHEKEETIPSKTPQMSLGDFHMIDWVYHKTSLSGKKLLAMICERNLFKRLLVISASKNPTLWDNLTKLRRQYEWPTWLDFQKKVQENLIILIDTLDDDERKITSVLSKDKTDEIVAMSVDKTVLFLVDIPGQRIAGSHDLYFLPEARISESLISGSENDRMEESVIWNDLSRNFLKSVGKIRVFCHPDIISTCTLCLKREKIEGALSAAYKYVTG